MTSAGELIGKTVLIGITRYEANGDYVGQEQMFGTIMDVNDRTIEIVLDNGVPYSLPPDTRPFQPADKGEYRLRSTGQVVIDPDYICTYSIYNPQRH